MAKYTITIDIQRDKKQFVSESTHVTGETLTEALAKLPLLVQELVNKENFKAHSDAIAEDDDIPF